MCGYSQARPLPCQEVKEENEDNRRLGQTEIERGKEMRIETNVLLRMEDMAKSDNVIFAGTGITKGDLLEGITRKGNIATTETLLIRGKCRTIRRIKSTHYLDRKDDSIKNHIV